MKTSIVPEHQGLGYYESQIRDLLGKPGHWHRLTPLHGQERRAWVTGLTREECEQAASDEIAKTLRVTDVVTDPSIPEGSFTIGPKVAVSKMYDVPEEMLGSSSAPNLLSGREDIATEVGLPEAGVREVEYEVDDDLGEPHAWQVVKPERGGKRTCRCDHSESRHNASGSCRTCACSAFRVVVA